MTTPSAQTRSPGCPCGRDSPLEECCGRYLSGAPAADPESLMRSRYSAYVLGDIAYLQRTTLPAQQSGLDCEAMRTWSLQSTWLGLEVEGVERPVGQPEHAFVTFNARWRDASGEHRHRERSAFVRHDGRWYFIDPSVPLQAGRNDPCPCGSGLKFKKCCADALRRPS